MSGDGWTVDAGADPSYVVYVMAAAPARINARLDEELKGKVDEIRRATKQTTTEVLVTALEQYHARLKAQAQAYPLFQETGFVGCADGPADLASEYKRLIDYGNKGAPDRPEDGDEAGQAPTRKRTSKARKKR